MRGTADSLERDRASGAERLPWRNIQIFEREELPKESKGSHSATNNGFFSIFFAPSAAFAFKVFDVWLLCLGAKRVGCD